jgi:hypothetical protein
MKLRCSNTVDKLHSKSNIGHENGATTASEEQDDVQTLNGYLLAIRTCSQRVDRPELHHGDTVKENHSKPNKKTRVKVAMSLFGLQRQDRYQYLPVRLPKPPDKRDQLVDDKEERPRWITRPGAEEGDALDDQSHHGEEDRTWLRRVNGHCVTHVPHHMLQRVDAS